MSDVASDKNQNDLCDFADSRVEPVPRITLAARCGICEHYQKLEARDGHVYGKCWKSEQYHLVLDSGECEQFAFDADKADLPDKCSITIAGVLRRVTEHRERGIIE